MSTFRKHFKVSWDGKEPVDVVTNAWDMAEGSEAAENGGATMTTFHAIYHCLQRYGHDLPPFNQWMDVLDDLTASKSENGSDSVDPTVPMVSTVAPSELPSSLVPSIGNG